VSYRAKNQVVATKLNFVPRVRNLAFSGTVYLSATSSEESESLNHTDHLVGGSCDDPYADVRDKLEALSARDKARFARHIDDDDKAQKQQDYSSSSGAHQQGEPDIPFFIAYTTYLAYVVLIVCGHFLDVFARIFGRGRYVRQASEFSSDDLKNYAPLLKSWENFYTRRLYHRIQDCFNRPIASNPGAHIHVLERVSYDRNKTMELLGDIDNLDTSRQKYLYMSGEHYHTTTTTQCVARNCLNLGSYNYLGFADDWNTTCERDVMASLDDLPVSAGSSRSEYGTTVLHRQVEQTVARFLNKQDAMCLNMGFNTNATTIPALVARGDLLISDQLNHTSIVNGARASGASIRTFRHNDMQHLEEILREAIVMGQPRTRRPWNKILIIVEGIYSMEGEYCDLRNVVRLAKQYGAYTYLDEAHSIGAMGCTGRGAAEYCGVDTADIDIMMGTFTKSFGGMGGYIAADKDVISFLRQKCAGSAYHNSLSPVVCQQIITSFKVSVKVG
jgi:serine palmitoyltransferase